MQDNMMYLFWEHAFNGRDLKEKTDRLFNPLYVIRNFFKNKPVIQETRLPEGYTRYLVDTIVENMGRFPELEKSLIQRLQEEGKIPAKN